MNKNFSIRDAVSFQLSDDTLDLRGDCELLNVSFHPGRFSSVEMLFSIKESNQRVQILFSDVYDFKVKGRDEEYPEQSGAVLKIAGFSSGNHDTHGLELYVEPTREMNYMTFIMDDTSAILVKAGTVRMRQL